MRTDGFDNEKFYSFLESKLHGLRIYNFDQQLSRIRTSDIGLKEFTNFIRIKNYENDIKIPGGEFAKKTLVEVTNAISSGVQKAYIKRKVPFNEIILEDKSEKYIGEFLQFKIMEIIFLAHLLEVNPFDQPNVEKYKIETRKILEGG